MLNRPDHRCEPCIAGFCLEHLRISIPTTEDVPSLRMEPVLSMSQDMVDGTLYINSEGYSNFSGEYSLVIFCVPT